MYVYLCEQQLLNLITKLHVFLCRLLVYKYTTSTRLLQCYNPIMAFISIGGKDVTSTAGSLGGRVVVTVTQEALRSPLSGLDRSHTYTLSTYGKTSS